MHYVRINKQRIFLILEIVFKVKGNLLGPLLQKKKKKKKRERERKKEKKKEDWVLVSSSNLSIIYIFIYTYTHEHVRNLYLCIHTFILTTYNS